MSSWTLTIGSAVGLAAAALYLALAWHHGRRVAAGGHFALGFFAIFWAAFGVHLAADSAWALAAHAWDLPPWTSETILHAKVATGALGMLGLSFYLLFLLSGQTWLLGPLAVYFLAVGALLDATYVSRGPAGHELLDWAARHAFERAAPPAQEILLALLFLPPLVSAAGYATLVRVARDPAHRRRIVLVSLSFAAFFAGLTLGFLNEQWTWWELAERGLAVAAAFGVLLARDRAPSGARAGAPARA